MREARHGASPLKAASSLSPNFTFILAQYLRRINNALDITVSPRQPSQQAPRRHTEDRMVPIRRDLDQGYQHEATLMHQWVRNRKPASRPTPAGRRNRSLPPSLGLPYRRRPWPANYATACRDDIDIQGSGPVSAIPATAGRLLDLFDRAEALCQRLPRRRERDRIDIIPLSAAADGPRAIEFRHRYDVDAVRGQACDRCSDCGYRRAESARLVGSQGNDQPRFGLSKQLFFPLEGNLAKQLSAQIVTISCGLSASDHLKASTGFQYRSDKWGLGKELGMSSCN
jgi:hypothetical protein